MPKRLGERQFPTPQVQSDGSWIRVRSLTVREVFDVQREREQVSNLWFKIGALIARVALFLFPKIRRKGRSEEYLDFARDVCSKVTAWNWVDGEGNPLPLPSDDTDVVGRLTDKELAVVAAAVFGQMASEEQKN